MNKRKSDKGMSQKVKEVVEAFVDEDSFKVDPNGSWTGRPADEEDMPIQDADDL